MKWSIPGKTFLLGEYAALANESALILTTTPYFQLSVIDEDHLIGIHPNSPAGIWWAKQDIPGKGLAWVDPHHGLGGLGASSAQFIGSYLADCALSNTTVTLDNLLNAYCQSSWAGHGLKPSGYDVIAQMHQGCVYINKQKELIDSYPWVFDDLSFFLIHTQCKLATHEHLKQITLPPQIDALSSLVDLAKLAFTSKRSDLLIHAINEYHQLLDQLNLVADHSKAMINDLQALPAVLAAKGCGALGADVILIITSRKDAPLLQQQLESENKIILATEAQLNNEKLTW